MKKHIFLFLVIYCNYIFAVDTIETFDLGFTDFEYYYNLENFNEIKKTIKNEIHIGIGIIENFSFCLNFQSQKQKTIIENQYSYGFIFNILNTANFDMDLYGQNTNNYEKTIGTEINFDYKEDLKDFGIYTRYEFNFNSKNNLFLLGFYKTIKSNLQLLSQIYFSTETKEKNIDLGINYQLNSYLELINQISLNNNYNISFMTGFLATLP